MIKKTLLAISALALTFGSAMAQKACTTNEMQAQLEATHPEIAQVRAALEAQIKAGLKKIDMNHFGRTTKTTLSLDDTEWYDIPIVVHLIHDYGTEYTTCSDDAIISAFQGWNVVYAGENTDTSLVIKPFKQYLGIPRIRLHFATIDPNGNPTKGITHTRSYLTHNASDYAKFEDWPPQSYVNIWFVNTFAPNNSGGSPAAYAYEPPDAASIPYWDGVIALSTYMPDDALDDVGGKCINHEMGHVFNLEHPWGNTNAPDVACGDDEVDDTPPTKGHDPVSNEGVDCNPLTAPAGSPLWDTICASGYAKSYPSSVPGIDSFVDYPDTANSQNIMDYTYCAVMFTKGQVYRMHAAMQSDVANRDSLWSASNLARTGALAPVPDLPIIPDFSIIMGQSFSCTSTSVQFTNRSWNDTLQTSNWTFSNGASTSTSTSNTVVTEKFSQPGWVTVSLTAQGNNTAAATHTDSQIVFIANPTATNPDGYVEEFNPTGDAAQWPMFNYYQNNFKWQLANVGLYDSYSMEYTGFDNREFPANVTGSPSGDIDDFFSIPFDLSAYTGSSSPLNLDFMYSGATRTANSEDMNDTLEIDYSINNASTWIVLKYLTKTDMLNKGTLATAYTPSSMSDWAPMSISIPAAAKTKYTLFRFRYKPGAEFAYYGNANNVYSTSNNFYMDRISISPYTAGVENVTPADNNIAVVPNPTNGAAYVVIKDIDNDMADIRVMDITGKTVYATHQQISGVTRVEIPQSYITVKGMYLVQVTTGNQSHTEKLVVY
jgi:hypothetical protein